MSVDLDELYSQTKKIGLIEAQTPVSSNVDLDELYSQTKKVGMIYNVQQADNEALVQSKQKELGDPRILFGVSKFIPPLRKLESELGRTRAEQFVKDPGMEASARRQQLAKQLGTSIALSGGTGAAISGARIPGFIKAGIEGAVGSQAFDGDVKQRLLNAAGGFGTGAALSGIPKIAGKVFFRKQLAHKELTEGVGKQLSQMKEQFASNPEVNIDASGILSKMESGFKKITVKSGEQAKVIREWIKAIKLNGGKLNGRQMLELEDDLGQVSKYGQYKKGVLSQETIKKPSLNKLAKEIRSEVSNTVDTTAESIGLKGWKDVSRKVSDLLKKYPDMDPTKGYGGFGTRLVSSALVGQATGNPLLGGMTYLAEKTIQSPEVRNALFKQAQSQRIASLLSNTRRVGAQTYPIMNSR